MGPTKLVATSALAALVVLTALSPAHADVFGKGTATSTLTAASVTVGSLVDADLVSLDAFSTLDKQRHAGVGENVARNTLTAAGVKLGTHDRVPVGHLTVSRSEGSPGEDRGPLDALSIAVPGALPALDVGATNADVARVVTDIQGTASSAVPDGSVLNGTVRPLDLKAAFDGNSAQALGGSTVDTVSALGGLVSANGLNVAEQAADATRGLSRGATRELTVDSVRVLDMGGVLHLLGVEPGSIPLATLTAMADELGVPLSGTLGSTPLSSYDLWADVNQTLTDTKDELTSAIDAGALCSTLGSTVGGLLGEVGVDCTGTLQQALDTVNQLIDDLLGIVTAVVEGATLLSVEGIAATVQTAASVTAEGIALTSAQAAGSAGRVKVGGTDLGAIAANLATSPLGTLQSRWNALGLKAQDAIDSVLTKLGDAYAGLVSVQIVPTIVQKTGVDGNYAVAEAALSLLKAQVTVPGELPDPQDLATLPAPTATTTTAPTTTTTLPLGVTTTTITLPPTTITLPSLNIAHVRDAGAVRGAVAGLAPSATVEVGVLSARSEFTLPGVEITGGGDNRTWNARTGFGTPGSLPRTGSSSGATSVLVFAALSATAYGLHRLGRSPARRIVG